MSKALKLFIAIKNDNDTYTLLHPLAVQVSLPTVLKKVPLIRADFTLEDDTEETSQTEIVDLSSIDMEKRRQNAKKAMDEALNVIEKLTMGDQQKEMKTKKIVRQKQERQEESRYFGTAYVSGDSGECQPLQLKPRPPNYEFYELWKLSL